MSIYDIDVDKEVRLYTPGRWRKAKRLAWLRTLVYAIKVIYLQFLNFRKERNYYLYHNGQVCYLEGALNDLFDPVYKRIFIGDGPYVDPLYIYTVPEERPVPVARVAELPVIDYDAPVYLYTGAETATDGVQFIVWYPNTLVFDANQMRALVDKYRLVGKHNYSLQSYS